MNWTPVCLLFKVICDILRAAHSISSNCFTYFYQLSKMRGKKNISMGIRLAAKVKNVTHEVKGFCWNINGNYKHGHMMGTWSTSEGKMINTKHWYFIIHDWIIITVIGCKPISSRLITIHMEAASLRLSLFSKLGLQNSPSAPLQKGKTPYQCAGYDTKFHLMVRLQSWKFGGCGLLLHCHYS